MYKKNKKMKFDSDTNTVEMPTSDVGKCEEFFSVSVMGGSHEKSGKPKQDYALAVKCDKYCIGIVCDGHGGNKYFRSDIGSKLAAEATRKQFQQLFKVCPSWSDIECKLPLVIDMLKLAIKISWEDAVLKYAQDNPYNESELAAVTDMGELKPYGTTLLATMITDEYYVNFVIGDGAMIRLLPDGSATFVKFDGQVDYGGPHSFTDSMCSSNAYEKMFVKICPLGVADEGVAFAMCSDGLSEAFTNDKQLIDLIRTYIGYYARNGLEKAVEQIGLQLAKLAKDSWAADDISLTFATNNLHMYVDQQQIEPEPEPESTDTVDAEEAPEAESTDTVADAEETPEAESTDTVADAEEAPEPENADVVVSVTHEHISAEAPSIASIVADVYANSTGSADNDSAEKPVVCLRDIVVPITQDGSENIVQTADNADAEDND